MELLSPTSKNKKIRSKKFLIFPEMELSSSKIKTFLIFPEMELSILIFFLSLRKELFELKK